MFFNIDADDGHSIRGWIALDNPTLIPVISVRLPGRPEIEVEASQIRSDVQELGIHATGQVGFEINEALVSDLRSIEDVALFEKESRLLIFRRATGRHLQKKLYLFDASLLPQNKVTLEIGGHFTLSYIHTEMHALETMLVLINNHFSRSTFMYGRSNFHRYDAYLSNNGFLRAALLQDPYNELAERLHYLKLIGQRGSLSPTPLANFESVLPMVNDLDFLDPKAMLQSFRLLNQEQRDFFTNPMVRLFGCDVDEPPRRRNVSIALENLASMDVVGVRSQFDLFRDLLAGALGADSFGAVKPFAFEPVTRLARVLSRIGLVTDLLEGDLELFSYANEAVQSALGKGTAIIERDTHSI